MTLDSMGELSRDILDLADTDITEKVRVQHGIITLYSIIQSLSTVLYSTEY